MKNTFKKLRAKLRFIEDKLDTANRTNSILSEEVKRLKRVLDIQQKKETVLNDKLKTESKRTENLANRIVIVKRSRDVFYKKWMQDHSKIKIWKTVGYIGIALNILGLIILIAKSLQC